MSESKNILITGGARGLGRVLGRYLAQRGHRLFLLDIDEEELKYAATVHIPQYLAELSGETSSKKPSPPEAIPTSGAVAGDVPTASTNGDVDESHKKEPVTAIQVAEPENHIANGHHSNGTHDDSTLGESAQVESTQVESIQVESTQDNSTPAKSTEDSSTHINGTQSNGSHGKEIHYRTVNLRDPVAVREAVKAAAEVFGGKIDVLINNAGIARAQWSGERSMDDESVNNEWIAYIETNLTGPFLVSQACIPFMKNEDKERKEDEFSIRPEAQVSADGRPQHEIIASIGPSTPCIINVSSFRALQSAPNCEGYASSKAGMLGLTHSMAISLARWGIRVNAILPGFVYVLHECREGDETGHTWAQPISASRHRTHPTGRIGRGDDVSKTVEWLIDADFVTGQEIVVDGGCSKIKYEHA